MDDCFCTRQIGKSFNSFSASYTNWGRIYVRRASIWTLVVLLLKRLLSFISSNFFCSSKQKLKDSFCFDPDFKVCQGFSLSYVINRGWKLSKSSDQSALASAWNFTKWSWIRWVLVGVHCISTKLQYHFYYISLQIFCLSFV